jgi:hypothetical protein
MKGLFTVILSSFMLFSCSPEVGVFDTINTENAEYFTTFDSTNIESMVTYYFASRIRNDEEWRNVLPDSSEWSDRMQYSIGKHNEWKFVEFKNLGIKHTDYGTSVKVYFLINVNGKNEGGEDDVEIIKVNNKWVIVKVPT